MIRRPARGAWGSELVLSRPARTEARTWPGRLGVGLPDRAPGDDREVLERLGTLRGAAFEDAFLRGRARGLARQVNTPEEIAAQAADPGLRDAAARALPGLDALRRQALDLRVALAPVGEGPVGAGRGGDLA